MALLPPVWGFFCILLFCVCNGQQQPQVHRLALNSSLQAAGTAATRWLLSPKGTFFFGLVSPSPGKWYLGISYNVVDDINIWIANRERPAADGAGVNLTSDGNVVLYDPQGVVWTSDTANKGVISAELRDSGNFAMLNSSNHTVWQSFEHPSDTWMPGMEMRLGYKLVSWRSRVDPSPGRYSMTLRPTSEYVSLWNSSVQYWTSGVWNKVIFTNVPQMRQDFIYNFTYVNKSSTEQYFTWSEKLGNSSHFTLGVDGLIRVSILQSGSWYNIFTEPENVCDVERLCGPYGVCATGTTTSCTCPAGFRPRDQAGWDKFDWSLGCVPTSPAGCDASEVSYSSLPSVTFNINGSSLPGMNQKSCEKMCTEDCSCVGYLLSSASACSIMSGPLVDGMKSSTSQDTVHLKVAGTGAQTRAQKSSTRRVVVIAVVASILALLALSSLAIVITICFRRRSSKTSSSVLLTSFTYKELQKATKNFSQKLGQGGFGAVFKGNLPESDSPVAVKRLDNMMQGEKEFHAEVRTLGTIQHINLVRLWGFCAEGSHRLLVYEFMGRGSLDKPLFGGSPLLDWDTRYNIALGTARALTYLHEECVNKIIHCDIKPENILLDADFSPKVSDFGLAKLLGRNVSRVITHMRGTRGYLAPEWISNLPITPKADVYSYGMMLLEIVGGRRNIDVHESLDKWHFPLWAYRQLISGTISEVPDDRLGNSFDVAQVERAVKVAFLCIQDEEEWRPSMSIVLQMLEGTVEVPMPRMPNSLEMMDVPKEHQLLEVPSRHSEDEQCVSLSHGR